MQSINRIFSGPNGIRAGWRFLLYILVLIILSIALRFLLFRVIHLHLTDEWTPGQFILSESLLAGIGLAGAWIMQRIERKRWSFSDYGLPRFNRLFWQGALWGMLTPLLLFAIIVLLGGAQVHGWHLAGSKLVGIAAYWMISMLLLGLGEEFLFRGYPQFTLASGIGFWPAAISISLFFGGLHYFTKGPLETIADGVSVTLIALLLCLTLRRTGNLWFAIGYHALFDFVALALLAAPNTGNNGKPVSLHLLEVTYNGPAWLTGGHCGIEASWMIFPLLAASFLLFHKNFRKSAVQD